MNKIQLKIGLVILIITSLYTQLSAQEVVNENQYRTAIGIKYKINKSWKLDFAPEFRFDETLSLDKFLIDGKLKYKPFKLISFGATYRFEVNYREVKETQYLNRFGLSTTLKKKVGRFEPSFRLKWSNYADDEITDENFLRYKFYTKYDIPKSKITPNIGLELFHQLSNSPKLYKVRYFIGLDYKISKKNYIGLNYKLDYYKYEYLNKHIFSLQYIYKF